MYEFITNHASFFGYKNVSFYIHLLRVQYITWMELSSLKIRELSHTDKKYHHQQPPCNVVAVCSAKVSTKPTDQLTQCKFGYCIVVWVHVCIFLYLAYCFFIFGGDITLIMFTHRSETMLTQIGWLVSEKAFVCN